MIKLTFLPQRGELTNGFLLISSLSGMILLFQFDVSTPLESVVYINSILPFGWFWRSIHYWSSQLFLLFLAIHLFERFDLLERFDKKKEKAAKLPENNGAFSINTDFIMWVVLVSTVVLGIIVLFTGYVIRWDETGRSAGIIASEILKSIPLFGGFIDTLLMDTGYEGINKAFALHINLTLLLWGIGSWYHTKRVLLGKKALWFSFITSMVFALIFIPQFKSPDVIAENIKGPWFFLGIQELLRYIPVFWAGVVFPLMPVILLIYMFFTKNKKQIGFYLLFWGLIYLFLTIIATLR
jgi:ubiquinol-cytochrome c reductase cytochrome b subunit